jgi:thioredoxin:protein disulfide reductase
MSSTLVSSSRQPWQRLATLLAGALLLALAYEQPQAAEVTPGADRLLPAAASEEFLPPDQAFRLGVSAESRSQLRLSWAIAPGYYLYQSRLKFSTSTPGATLGKAALPAGQTKHDEYFGDQVVYHSGLMAQLPVLLKSPADATLALRVTYQGCAEAGLCYPPITKDFVLTLPRAGAAAAGASAGASGPAGGDYVSEQDRMANLLRTGSLGAIVAGFYLIGLLLSFTGCVLPTIPILSGIIVGQGASITTARAFLLSLTYVLGMALTYTIAGALTAASGLQVQAAFQRPWTVLLFAALMLAMAASMFGLFTLQMPSAIQTRIAELSNRQRGGTFAGVAMMGLLSSLIVTACMAPALVGALAVISQTGKVMVGATALFAMSMGTGTPLLLIGTSAGKLLPRAGAWMDDVKRFGGCLMLGVAAWMLSRLVSDATGLLLYSVPFIAALVVLWRFAVRGRALSLLRVAALCCGMYAAALVTGYVRGASDPLHPLTLNANANSDLNFLAVRTLADLDQQVREATTNGRAVMLDFYADWCTSCKEMERYTFSNQQVQGALQNLVLLRADVTANNDNDRALMKRFGIFGPPTIAFFSADGREQAAFRVAGYMKAGAFAQLLGRVSNTAAAAPASAPAPAPAPAPGA